MKAFGPDAGLLVLDMQAGFAQAAAELAGSPS
jgi:hypothetical protein